MYCCLFESTSCLLLLYTETVECSLRKEKQKKRRETAKKFLLISHFANPTCWLDLHKLLLDGHHANLAFTLPWQTIVFVQAFKAFKQLVCQKSQKIPYHTNHGYHVDGKLLMTMRICQKNCFLFRTCVHERERKSARKSSWEVRKWEKREKEKFPTFPRCMTDFSVELDRFVQLIFSRGRVWTVENSLSFDFWKFV